MLFNAKIFWKVKAPMKVKHLIWRDFADGLPTREKLRRRAVDVPLECPFCEHEMEIADAMLSKPLFGLLLPYEDVPRQVSRSGDGANRWLLPAAQWTKLNSNASSYEVCATGLGAILGDDQDEGLAMRLGIQLALDIRHTHISAINTYSIIFCNAINNGHAPFEIQPILHDCKQQLTRLLDYKVSLVARKSN
ncbi:hypothetical protein RIF29_21881 [Crotalaria pallida]|uniref:Reverse transcriptase zinc-binding domain-containing protein n=1 Tax=Crotalaria pallida TaxID=3830 RepID=A0AAN9F644_CROPI